MNNLVLLKQRIGQFPAAEQATPLPLPSIRPAWQPSRPFIQASALNSPARLLYAVTAANVLIAYDLAAAAVSFTVNLCCPSAPPSSSPPAPASAQHEDDILTPPEDDDDDGAAAAFLPLSDSVVSLHYVAELESLHVASRCGCLLSVHALTQEVTAIGDIAGGIAACSLSPDRELLAIVTSRHRLLLLTPDGERLLLDAAIVESGAGVLPSQSLQPVQPHDERETDSGASISWRGDGQFFAVSLYHSAFRYRRIRVFSRQGEQSSQSFPFPCQDSVGALGLSPLLCWRPSGNLITASERRVGGGVLKHEVVFFERNGLRLGELMLRETQAAAGGNTAAAAVREERKERKPLPPRRRKDDDGEEQKVEETAEEADSAALSSSTSSLSSFSDVDLLDLAWNADSDLLALLVREQSSLQPAVLLFSVSNYQYQIKYRFVLPASSFSQLSLLWDAETALHLLVIAASGEVHSLSFAWDVAVSLTEQRWAAVVDGPTLALTPLARAIIPPPLSFASVVFPSCILALTFAASSSSSSSSTPTTALCVLCSDSTIHLLPDIDTLPRRAALPLDSLRHISLSLTSLLPSSPTLHLRQLLLLPSSAQDSGRTVLLAVNALAGGEELRDEVIELRLGEKGQVEELHRTPAPAASEVLRLSYSLRHGCLYLQAQGGQVHRYARSSPSCPPSLSAFSSFPSPCPDFGVTEMGGVAVSVGRDSRCRLYCDSTLLTPLCSSFSLSHPSFLIFTVSGAQNAMFFLPLSATLSHSLSPSARSDPHAVRLVEKGGALVATVPPSSSCILQMPRGNLETVYPRALTLASLSLHLRAGNWKAAWQQARRSRVDLNLLFDFDPQTWWTEAESFVQAVGDVEALCLFMSCVVDRDVRAEDFPNWETADNRQSDRRRDDGLSDPRRAAAEPELDAVRAGLIGRDGREKRGQRLHLDRRAREKAAMEQESRLAAPSSSSSSSAAASSFLEQRATRGKVNLICERLRSVFLRLSPSQFALCVLTSFVRQQPPELERALQMIKAMKDEEKAAGGGQTGREGGEVGRQPGSREDRVSGPYAGADGAVRYIIFLCDVTALYSVALGLYDEQLVLMIAQHAQMDPKEHLPVLRALFAEHRRRMREAAIDRQLRRWDKVLRSLILAVEEGETQPEQEWPELLRLVQEKELWTLALQLLTPPSLPSASPSQQPLQADPAASISSSPHYDLRSHNGRYQSLLRSYASHLLDLKRPSQAAAAFVLAGDSQAAMLAYRDSGQWRVALSLAQSLRLSADRLRELLLGCAAVLRERGGEQALRDAASLLMDAEDDVEEAVSLLCQAEDWEEAMRLCWTRGGDELVRQLLQPQLRQGVERMQRTLDRRREKYLQAVSRLRVVRRAKLILSQELGRAAAAAAGGRGGAAPDEDADDDLVSIVSDATDAFSSSASSMTGISGITGLTAASAASSSSIFSVAPSSSSAAALTADERRIARHAQRLASKQSKRRIKEGSRGEEAALLQLITDVRLTPAVRQRVMRTVTAALLLGWAEEARRLQAAMAALEAVQRREEEKEMPMLEGLSEEQRAKLSGYWDWPGSVQRELKAKDDEADAFIHALQFGQQSDAPQLQEKTDGDKGGGAERGANGSLAELHEEDEDEAEMLGSISF